MKMKKLNQTGFALIIVLIPLVVVIIGAIGVFVWSSQQSSKTSSGASGSSSVSEATEAEICGSTCINNKLDTLLTFIQDGIKQKDLTADPDLTSGFPKTLTSGSKTIDTKGRIIYVDINSGDFCISSPFGSRYKTVTKADPDSRTTTKRCKSAVDSPY